MSRLPQRVCDGVKKAVMDNYSISKLGLCGELSEDKWFFYVTFPWETGLTVTSLSSDL